MAINDRNNSSAPIYLATGPGEVFSLTQVRGMKLLTDGRVLLSGESESPLIIFDPSDYEGVSREEVLRTYRHLMLSYAKKRPIVVPDWIEKILEA